MVRIDRNQWRVYVCKRRLHHGAVGLGFALIGVALMAHDRADAAEWLRPR